MLFRSFRKAAELNAQRAAAQGPALIARGRKAVSHHSMSAMIAADMAFHDFIYALSGNPLVAPSMQTHWTHTQRVMGEVLNRDDKPRDIWDQHEALLEAVASGKGTRAEQLARQHILSAADFMIERLRAEQERSIYESLADEASARCAQLQAEFDARLKQTNAQPDTTSAQDLQAFAHRFEQAVWQKPDHYLHFLAMRRRVRGTDVIPFFADYPPAESQLSKEEAEIGRAHV